MLIARVTSSFLRTLEAPDLLDHPLFLNPAPDLEGRVAILSHAFWQSRLAGNSQILGQTLTINGRSVAVVGIAPATFRFPALAQPDAIILLNVRPGDARIEFVHVIGRVAPGASIPELERDLRHTTNSHQSEGNVPRSVEN